MSAVRSMRHTLRDLYDGPNHNPRDAARLNAELGEALKLAEVHAVLAVADELRDLRDYFEGQPC